MAASRGKPSTERPEPWATPSSTLTTIAGFAVRSTTREARIPMTPRCHPSPSTTRSGDRQIRRLREPGFDRGERLGFGFTALAVEDFQLGGEFLARPRSRVQKSSTTSDATSMRPAALMRGARRKATSKPVIFRCRIEQCGGEQGAQADAHRPAKLAKPKRGNDAVFSAKRNSVSDGGNGRHLEKAGQSFPAGALRIAAFQQRLRQLERDGGAAQRFLRVRRTPAGWD